MKRTGLYLILFALFLGTSSMSIHIYNPFSDISDQVVEAIQKGSAREVASHFGATVELNLPANEGTFSRNQAEVILRNFFSRNAPESFTVKHHGPARDGSIYVIGRYESENGKSFRTYFVVKNISGKMVLHLLQLEEQ